MNKFEPVSKEFLKEYNEVEEVILPLRGSKTSAGYDFYATKDLEIKPQQKVLFHTDVKVKLDADKVLLGVIRSSKGIKDDLMLCNTIGVIDSDFYNNVKDGGNIGFALRNLRPAIEFNGYVVAKVNAYIKGDNKSSIMYDFVEPLEKNSVLKELNIPIPMITSLEAQNTVKIKKGDRVVQGLILTYTESENCNTNEERVGGYGSTGK